MPPAPVTTSTTLLGVVLSVLVLRGTVDGLDIGELCIPSTRRIGGGTAYCSPEAIQCSPIHHAALCTLMACTLPLAICNMHAEAALGCMRPSISTSVRIDDRFSSGCDPNIMHWDAGCARGSVRGSGLLPDPLPCCFYCLEIFSRWTYEVVGSRR